MAFDLSDKLVIGLASSALFDLSESDEVFRTEGEDVYRQYQLDNQDTYLKPGVAFPFIRRLLQLNKLDIENPPIEVILLSRNDPDTGLRVMNSIEHYNLSITRAVFLQGESPHIYIPAFNIKLFLSANSLDVKQAILAGYPAGQILPGNIIDDLTDLQLRIAFDFDGVLADDESETIFKGEGGLDEFHEHEAAKSDIPHNPGPLRDFFGKLAYIQKLEDKRLVEDPSYVPILKVSIITARNAPSHKRVINTMRSWKIRANEAFFMGGVDKSKVLRIMKPHMFFDDQIGHLEASSEMLPSVHIPFGIANKEQVTKKV